MTTIQTALPRSPRKLRSRSGSKTFWLTTMMLPVTIWLLLIRYLPMFGIMMSFLDYKLPTRKVPFPLNLLKSPWVGLKNFQFLFTSESLTMIRNTIGYNALWIVLGLLISVAFAIMMSELTRKFLAKTYTAPIWFIATLSNIIPRYSTKWSTCAGPPTAALSATATRTNL